MTFYRKFVSRRADTRKKVCEEVSLRRQDMAFSGFETLASGWPSDSQVHSQSGLRHSQFRMRTPTSS